VDTYSWHGALLSTGTASPYLPTYVSVRREVGICLLGLIKMHIHEVS
jgi:hypothetical protein